MSKYLAHHRKQQVVSRGMIRAIAKIRRKQRTRHNKQMNQSLASGSALPLGEGPAASSAIG